MAVNSKIEWTDHTFNPWLGCTKVSPGCDNCYAESWSKRSGLVKWGSHARKRTTDAYWRGLWCGIPELVILLACTIDGKGYSARHWQTYSIIRLTRLGVLIFFC